MKRTVKSMLVLGHCVWMKMWLKGRSCGTWEYSGKKECKARRQGYSEHFQILRVFQGEDFQIPRVFQVDFQILRLFQVQVLCRKRYLIYIKYGSQHTFLPSTWLLGKRKPGLPGSPGWDSVGQSSHCLSSTIIIVW